MKWLWILLLALPAGAQTIAANHLTAGSINGAYFPARCGDANRPSWCSGTTADAWIRAACSQLPATGGVIDQLGLTGNLAAAITGCMSPTKQVVFIQDVTTPLTITESDGGITYPLDNGSMLIGPAGGGQCTIGGGIHLASTANVTAIAGPAHTDGTQEDFTVEGVCMWGSTAGVAGTVTKGMIYAKEVFVNTTIMSNNVSVCPSSCLWIENDGGIVNVGNNEFNGTSGVYTFNTSPIVVASTGSAGCQAQSINIWGGNAEHANGGASYPEINVYGNGSGAQACGLYVHDVYVEKNVSGTPSTVAISIQDCFSCDFSNIEGGGGSGTSGDMVNISASQYNRVSNISFYNISNVFNSWTNTINDTTTGGSVIPVTTYPFVTSYISNPGYQQPPVLPGTILQSLGSDFMSGAGSFATGTGTIGTNFQDTGCLTTVTCTYTRTNATAPTGYTYSQEVQITANTDPSSGYNGVQYIPSVSFTAGQQYQATFWAKGDGTFTGFPTFLLWNSTIPVFYCDGTSSMAFSTTWTLYSFSCTPTTSGTAYLAVAARTPIGATGTFYFGGFIFSAVQPLAIGNLLTSIGPYGIGAATSGQQTITINSVACVLGNSCTVSGGSTPYPSGSGIPIVVSGTSWGTTVAAPSGTIVGTTDTQTLTNKTVVTGGVNAQTGTTYTVVAADTTKLVTYTNSAAVAVTLPVATTAGFTSGYVFNLKNQGTSVVTITPTTSTIDGNASAVLYPGQGIQIWSDGTNYKTQNQSQSTVAPTLVAVTAGAGTGNSIALAANSTNYSGQVQLTAGSGSGSNSAIFTLTFANSGFVLPEYCQITPASYQASAQGYTINGSNSGGNETTSIQLYTVGALLNGDIYYWNYFCPKQDR